MSRQTLLKLHRWVGLAVGLLLLVQASTGASIVFRDEIDRLLYSELTVAPQAIRQPAQKMIDKVRVALPDAKLLRIEFPDDSTGVVMFHLTTGTAKTPYLAAVDPYSGSIVRQGGFTAWPTELLFHIHDSLLSGEVGDRIIGFEGLALLFMVVTGPIVWWPGRKRLRSGFRVIVDSGTDRTVRTLHRAAGAAVAAILMVSATTGAVMIFKADIQPLVQTAFTFVPKPSPKVDEQKGAATIPADLLIAAALRDYGTTTLKELRYPGGKQSVVAVYLKDDGALRTNATRQIFYNAYDGTEIDHYVPAALPGANTFFDWQYSIHTGKAFGLIGRILIEIGGLGLIFFTISGFWLWLSSRRQQRVRKAKAAARKAVTVDADRAVS